MKYFKSRFKCGIDISVYCLDDNKYDVCIHDSLPPSKTFSGITRGEIEGLILLFQNALEVE